MQYLLTLLLALPLVGCGTFDTFAEEVKVIEAETSTLLEEADDRFTAGEITFTEYNDLSREILQESKARLDAAAREAGDSILGTGNDILDLLIILLFGGGGGAGALALARRVRGPRV